MKLQSALLLFVFLFSTMTINAKTQSADWCERQWSIESSSVADLPHPDYELFLKRWLNYADRCSGTVIYESRLVTIYILLNMTDKAREILKPYANSTSAYKSIVEFSLLQADATDVINSKLDLDSVQKLEERYLQFVKKYPDFPDGFAVLGGLQTTLEKHVEAIKVLEVGLRSSMDISGVYRNLTISYTEVGRYNEAMHAADQAYGLKKSLTSDPYFMYAAAKASAGVGNLHTAEVTLRLIAAKKPEVIQDPEFKKAVDFVNSKRK